MSSVVIVVAVDLKVGGVYKFSHEHRDAPVINLDLSSRPAEVGRICFSAIGLDIADHLVVLGLSV